MLVWLKRVWRCTEADYARLLDDRCAYLHLFRSLAARPTQDYPCHQQSSPRQNIGAVYP